MTAQELQQILVTKIKNSPQQQITFAEYMELALYDRQYGYYNSGVVSIGSKGDFFTSSSLGQDFGQLLGIQFQQMWHQLGCPNPFYLVEMGAGNGELAKDILDYLLENDTLLSQALNYIIIEQSDALRQKQQELLSSCHVISVSWQNWSDLADNSLEGCFFSNELVDAFPVHLITKNEDQLQEVYVSLEQKKLTGEHRSAQAPSFDGGVTLTEKIQPLSSQAIVNYFELIGINLLQRQYPHNYRTEVNLYALDWLTTVSNKLKRGYILTIDYGYTADKYYRPARSQGTLQCYYQHRRHNNPYVNLGYQDITAHIDFTALQRHGELNDLVTVGFTQQGLFLMALGLGDRLNELSSGKYSIPEIFKRRDALHQLIDPTGLGGFGVLIQAKNLTAAEQSLQGLATPSMF